jgi:tRNA-2-methylthio-N6-dimethylallyladenosine synthase
MKGCDHYCSYCIVPMTRGKEKSRPLGDVLQDVEELVSRGVREVTFLGQNINTYGKRTADDSLHALFRRVHEIEGLHRIRFTTSHPGDLTDELVECFRDLPKLCSQFHLPVQSGSNRVLRAMRRFYTKEIYLERVRALRRARPDISFSTDIIVGFPGETEEEFQETYALCEEVRYENAYSFAYSPRPGTSASLRDDQIPDSVKLARLTKLQSLLRRTSLEEHEKDVGKVKEILLEGPSKRDPLKWTGRSSQNVPVHVDMAAHTKAGDLCQVLIESATLTHLKGQLLSSAQTGSTRFFSSSPAI